MDILGRVLGREIEKEKRYFDALGESLVEFLQWVAVFQDAMKRNDAAGMANAQRGCLRAWERSHDTASASKRMPITLWEMIYCFCDGMLMVLYGLEVVQGLRTEQEAIEGLVAARGAASPSMPTLLNDRLLEALRHDGFGTAAIDASSFAIRNIANQFNSDYPQYAIRV